MPTSSFTGGNAGSGINKNVNNVIYVQDNGNQNLDGYLTVSGDATLNSDLFVAGNTTLDGNLIVNGSTTTIDTATLTIEDPVITLAKNANVNPTATTDAGLFIQRGSTEQPAIFIWNETLNQFEVSTVTGATSATTNFTGGGVTKTFASFKGGNLYGSTIDIAGLGGFGNITTSLISIGEHNYDNNGITLGEYGNLNIHSDQSYSSILLNYNVTSGVPTTNATIEVKRGSLTSALLKWDETNDAWDINNNLYSQKIKVRTDETSGSSSRVYIYFYHGTGMLNEVVYFYIYKTTDSGVTRKVIPINIVTSSRIEAYTSNGYNAIKFNSNTPYSSHANADAFIDMEDGASYYINVYSPNSSGLAPTVSFSFRYTSNVGLSANYTTILNADYIASGGYNGLIQVNNVTPLVQQVFSAGTNISNSIDNLPSLSLEYSKGIASLVLNAGITDTPADASILVDRGLSSPATLLWDESQTSWIINQDVRLSDGTNTPDLYLEDSSSIYLQGSGTVWINDGILALESRSSNTTRIYLNNELAVGDTPTTDAKITVNRGNQTNAEIKWDETNDVWDITHPLAIDNNLLKPYYVYMTYNANSKDDFEYFYFYSTTDGGLTRKVLPLKSLDATNFDLDVSLGYERYIAKNASDYTNSTPTTTGVLYLETNKTYYMNISTIDFSDVNDVRIYISSTILGSAPTYTNIVNNLNNDYQLVAGSNLDGTSWLINALVPTSAVTLYDESPTSTLVNLNSNSTSALSSIKMQVQRGGSTPSHVKWDELNGRWELSHDLALNTNNLYLNAQEHDNPTVSAGFTIKRGNFVDKAFYWNETDDHWDTDAHFSLGHTRRTRYYVYIRTANPVSADVGSYFYFYTLDGSIHRSCELSVKNTSIILSSSYSSGNDNYTRYSLNTTVYQPTLPAQVICIASFDLPEGSTIYFKEYLNSGIDYIYISRGGSHYFSATTDYISIVGTNNNNLQITADSNTKTTVTHTARYVVQEYNYQISYIQRSVQFRGSIDFYPTTVTVTSTNQVIGVGGENMIVVVPSAVTSCYIAPSFTNGKVIRIFNYSTANFTLNVIQTGHNGTTYRFNISDTNFVISRETTAQLLWYVDGSGNGHWLAN